MAKCHKCNRDHIGKVRKHVCIATVQIKKIKQLYKAHDKMIHEYEASLWRRGLDQSVMHDLFLKRYKERSTDMRDSYIRTLLKYKPKGGVTMAAKKQSKRLIIEFDGTTRKARDFEKDLRTFIDSYMDRAGVDDINVEESNSWIKRKLSE